MNLNKSLFSSSQFLDFIFDLESSQSLVIEYLTELSVVKSEVESNGCREGHNTCEDHKVRIVSVTMSIKRIITNLITIWFIVSVGLVNNKIGMRVWGENVFVTKQ